MPQVLSENDERRLRAVENAVLAMNDIAAEIATQQKRLPELIAGSFVAGVERVAGDDEVMAHVWSSFGAHMQRKAREGAGGWVLGILRSGLSWAVIFVLVASYIGWIPAWKVMQGAKP